MNSQTKSLLDEVSKHATASATESSGLFAIPLAVNDAETWDRLKEIRDSGPSIGITVRASDLVSDDGYDMLDNEFGSTPTVCRLNIAKLPVSGQLRFFTVDGLNSALRKETEKFESVERVRVAEACSRKSTSGLQFEQWLDDDGEDFLPPTATLPRRLVNDMTGKGVVPLRVSTWIANESENVDDTLCCIASRQLALCIPNALSSSVGPGEIVALIKTGRKISAKIEALSEEEWNDKELLGTLSEVCRWIYFEDREADVKHTLLTSELSRVWRSTDAWGAGLKNCLAGSFEAAKIAYRLHIQTKGIDAFKLMSDLRKGLTDDVRSLATNTASLSSGLWRDAAVAFGVVVARASSTAVGPWLLYVAAAYLLASCYFTCRAASNSVNSTLENEKSFRTLLYRPLLVDNEYEELAGKHYRDALRDFEWFRLLIVLAYVVTSSALIYVALSTPEKPFDPFLFR